MAIDIFEHCYQDDEHLKVKAVGLYPYFRTISQPKGPVVTIDEQEIIMLGSNNYLGLTTHPYVKEATAKAIEKYGTGCSGSRFLNGTLDIHVELEERLARFFNKEAVILFSTGFQANLGALSCLAGPDDVIVSDEENHASIVNGCRLSKARTVVYQHNDMADLERRLQENQDIPGGLLIVTDGVFSMSGDIANVPAIAKLAKQDNARLYVDYAHGAGVLGERGAGTGEHWGMEDDVDVIMGTFSKSFASLGGYIASEEAVIQRIKHRSRPFIFHASNPPSAVAAVLAVLDILEQGRELIDSLWKNVRQMKAGLQALGYEINSQSPILPFLIGPEVDTFVFAQKLFEHGIFTNPVIAPAVPKGHGAIRTSYMATHNPEVLDRALGIIEKLSDELRETRRKGEEYATMLGGDAPSLGVKQTVAN